MSLFSSAHFSRLEKGALIVLFLNHAIGAVGLNYASTKGVFESVASINLLVSAALVFSFHSFFNSRFFLYAVITIMIGLSVEIMGVQTGFPFGSYFYTVKLGPRLFGVPVIIGLNWLLLSYCCSVAADIYFTSTW